MIYRAVRLAKMKTNCYWKAWGTVVLYKITKHLFRLLFKLLLTCVKSFDYGMAALFMPRVSLKQKLWNNSFIRQQKKKIQGRCIKKSRPLNFKFKLATNYCINLTARNIINVKTQGPKKGGYHSNSNQRGNSNNLLYSISKHAVSYD